jgi:hypothetical protein
MKYGSDSIETQEALLWQKKKEIEGQYLAKFVEKNPLIIPLKNMQISFDPGKISVLKDYGKVYKFLILKDYFGELNAKKGALLSPDYQKVIVSEPQSVTDTLVIGDGYTINLDKEFVIVKSIDGTFKLQPRN